MKCINKEVEMVAWFGKKGQLTPSRFRLEKENGELVVIKIDKIINQEKLKLAGSLSFKYTCQSEIRGEHRLFELRYYVDQVKWVLFKI